MVSHTTYRPMGRPDKMETGKDGLNFAPTRESAARYGRGAKRPNPTRVPLLTGPQAWNRFTLREHFSEPSNKRAGTSDPGPRTVFSKTRLVQRSEGNLNQGMSLRASFKRASGSIGLVMCSSKPAARASSRSRVVANPDKAMAGIFVNSGRRLTS